MQRLEMEIHAVLRKLKSKLAEATWESMQRNFNQMLTLADTHNIIAPCQELYHAFIADDNNSKERRSMHLRCVRLLDAATCTQARGVDGNLYNEPPMPSVASTLVYFKECSYPLRAGIDISYLIVKAQLELHHLSLSNSTIGQYRHAWMDMRRFFIANGSFEYKESMLHEFVQEISRRCDSGELEVWKWKIGRRAAFVLKEVAKNGSFNWKIIKKDLSYANLAIEDIRQKYLDSLVQRNLSVSTINLHDYVFRNAIAFCGVTSPEDLFKLTPNQVRLAIVKFSEMCGKRSMATILPILRSMIQVFHAKGWIEKDSSGIVMSGFVQKNGAPAYINEDAESKLIRQLDMEPKRTKAIVLLAMRLGLRDCDICNLDLNDIDWRNDKIRLTQKKTGKALVLPLLPDVGNALMDYLIDERPQPQDGSTSVFLRKQAPYRNLSSAYTLCSNLLAKLSSLT